MPGFSGFASLAKYVREECTESPKARANAENRRGREYDMGQRFSGSTDEASPLLAAIYWKRGTSIAGTFTGTFTTSAGECFQFNLKEPMKVDGKHCSPSFDGSRVLKAVSVGALKGFAMALRATGAMPLHIGDFVEISCIGSSPSGKGSDMVRFAINVSRD
jgi:hypothetical protein